MENGMDFFANKRVLVTGACGTVGRELVRQLLEEKSPGELVCIDNNESDLFFLGQHFADHKQASFFLADVRDAYKLRRKMRDIDIVFHTAAFKHVNLCEVSPFEAVQTNIIGVQNVINAAVDCKVKRVVFTSSDKAVNPTNVMGTSKLMGERLMTAANANLRKGDTIFVSTRFGNVLGSRGSVIPIFREQIKRRQPVTLTDPAMTRFIMSISEAVNLLIDSLQLANGGCVFVTKMPVIRIKELAEVMIEELAPVYGHDPAELGIEIIGAKPGEKMYEELMSGEETARALELSRYFVVLPAFRGIYNRIEYNYPGVVSTEVSQPYNSSNVAPISKDELRLFLREHNLLVEDDELWAPMHRSW